MQVWDMEPWVLRNVRKQNIILANCYHQNLPGLKHGMGYTGWGKCSSEMENIMSLIIDNNSYYIYNNPNLHRVFKLTRYALKNVKK